MPMFNRLFCDKISFTGQFEDKKEVEWFRRFLLDEYSKLDFKVMLYGRYKYQVFIPQNDVKTNSLLQFGGEGQMSLSWRFEFNPQKSSKILDELFMLVIERTKINQNLGQSIRVTRMDLTIDLPYNINDLEIKYMGSAKTGYIYGRDKKLETFYIGWGETDKKIRVYDKAKEQKKEGDWTRVEAQIRDLGYLQGLVYQYPYENLEIYHKAGDEYMPGLFEEQIPLQYEALIFYFASFPWKKGGLKRYMREQVEEYEKRQRNDKEIDLKPIADEGIIRIFDYWKTRVGIVGGDENNYDKLLANLRDTSDIFYIKMGWEELISSPTAVDDAINETEGW